MLLFRYLHLVKSHRLPDASWRSLANLLQFWRCHGRHLPGVGPAGWQGSQLSLRRGAAEAASAGACDDFRRAPGVPKIPWKIPHLQIMSFRKSMKIHENLWKSMKIYENPWKSMKIYENPWKSMKIYENPWKSMKIHENPWKSMKIHVNLWKSMKIHENPWKSMKIHENLWKSMKIYENLWKSMKIHENPWKSMKIYENLWKSMKIHENPWKSMKIHENPWKSMKIHENLWKSMKIYENPMFFRKHQVFSGSCSEVNTPAGIHRPENPWQKKPAYPSHSAMQDGAPQWCECWFLNPIN